MSSPPRLGRASRPCSPPTHIDLPNRGAFVFTSSRSPVTSSPRSLNSPMVSPGSTSTLHASAVYDSTRRRNSRASLSEEQLYQHARGAFDMRSVAAATMTPAGFTPFTPAVSRTIAQRLSPSVSPALARKPYVEDSDSFFPPIVVHSLPLGHEPSLPSLPNKLSDPPTAHVSHQPSGMVPGSPIRTTPPKDPRTTMTGHTSPALSDTPTFVSSTDMVVNGAVRSRLGGSKQRAASAQANRELSLSELLVSDWSGPRSSSGVPSAVRPSTTAVVRPAGSAPSSSSVTGSSSAHSSGVKSTRGKEGGAKENAASGPKLPKVHRSDKSSLPKTSGTTSSSSGKRRKPKTPPAVDENAPATAAAAEAAFRKRASEKSRALDAEMAAAAAQVDADHLLNKSAYKSRKTPSSTTTKVIDFSVDRISGEVKPD